MIAFLIALLSTSLVTAPTAHAATDRLVVTLTKVTVAGPDATSKVVISGTVTNPTANPVYGVQVVALAAPEPYRSLPAVRNAIAGQHGSSSQRVAIPSSLVDNVTDADESLDPGETDDFSVTGTLAQLGWAANASYWVGAEATGGTHPGWGALASLTGRAETLATVPDTVGPTIATVVHLATTPRRVRPNVFSDDRMATDLAPTGRLGRLLEAVENERLDYAIDPELLDEVSDMADGYSVIDGSDEVEGTGQNVAALWLNRFNTLPKTSGLVTLYGSPDLVGAAAAKSTTVLSRSVQATNESALALPTVALQRRMSKSALAQLAQANIPVLTPSLDADSPWVSLDGARVSGAYWASKAPDQPNLGAGAVGREAAALAVARAVGSQVRLVTSTADLDAESALPRWVKRTSWSTLASTPAPSTTVALEPATAKGALTKAQVERLDLLASGIATYASAAPKSNLEGMAPRLTSAAASEAWLTSPAGRRSYTGLVAERTGAAALVDGIEISVAHLVTLGGSDNTFPATITNHLPNTITVRIVGVSSNSARIRVDASELVTIAPDDSYGVQVPATATGNGVVSATLHVESETGMRVSPDVPVTLEATNLGALGWIIMAVSFVVLVVTSALRIRQVRRRNAR